MIGRPHSICLGCALALSVVCLPALADQVANDWDRLAEVFAEAREQTQAAGVRGTFEQHRYSPLLDDAIVSTGQFARVGRTIRFDTDTPHRSQMLVDTETVTLYFPDDGLAERFPLDEEDNVLGVALSGKLTTLQATHNLTLDDSHAATWVAHFAPLSDSPGPQVSLTFAPDTAAVTRIQTESDDGQRSDLRLLDLESAPELQADDLQLTWPADTEVSDFTVADRP